jgi:hypothetical protein
MKVLGDVKQMKKFDEYLMTLPRSVHMNFVCRVLCCEAIFTRLELRSLHIIALICD